jgi:hypothetical protein
MSRYVIVRRTPSGKVPYGQLLSEEYECLNTARKKLYEIQSVESNAAIFERVSPTIEQWMLWPVLED